MTITDEELMKMNLEELKGNHKKSSEDYQKEYGKLKGHITEVLERYITELGMKDFAIVRCVSDSSAEILVGKGKGCNGHSIDLSFYERFYNETPHVHMNYWSFGSFDNTADDKVKYMIALGKVAENLGNIEREIMGYDWKNYYSVMHKMSHDESLINRYEDIIANNEKKEKEAKLLSKMKEGSEIIVDVRNRYESGKIVWYDVVKTIGSITAKNIMFKEDYGRRTKKDYALGQMLLGYWKLKEKESDTLVKKQQGGL